MGTEPVSSLLPSFPLERAFRTKDRERDKFLSRLFGIFSEEIVRHWCSCDGAPYADMGRPTLWVNGETRGATLDFALKSRSDGRIFVAELKAEMEFENYRYLTLSDRTQLEHHRREAFKRFLQAARDPHSYQVKVAGREVDTAGAVLVWGAVTETGKRDVKAATGVADVLSLEDMLSDLAVWDSPAYKHFLARRAAWCEEIFRFLSTGTLPIRA